MLKLIRTIHTIIWCILVSAVIYTLLAGIFNWQNWILWLAIILIVTEGSVLFIHKFTCPLTTMAKRLVKNETEAYGLYLPKWFEPYNRKRYFACIFGLGVILILYNNFWR